MMKLFSDSLKNFQAIEKSSSICELEGGWSDEDTSSLYGGSRANRESAKATKHRLPTVIGCEGLGVVL